MAPTFEMDKLRLNYRVDGAPDAPFLVLANSLGTGLAMWDGQIEALTRRFRVLRYDMRGHGASSVAGGPYSIELLARDLIGLLDGLQLPRAHFCGLSMGGMVGMWIGAHAPERLNRLVLCNTAALIGPPSNWNGRIEAVRKGGMAAVVPDVLERWFTQDFRQREPVAVERAQRMLLATHPDGYIGACAAVRDMDLRDHVAKIHTPTLVIAGELDPATPPAEGQWLAQRIAGARYAELPAAHLSNIEAERQFNDTVVHFLTC